jgi:hypothetical protein
MSIAIARSWEPVRRCWFGPWSANKLSSPAPSTINPVQHVSSRAPGENQETRVVEPRLAEQSERAHTGGTLKCPLGPGCHGCAPLLRSCEANIGSCKHEPLCVAGESTAKDTVCQHLLALSPESFFVVPLCSGYYAVLVCVRLLLWREGSSPGRNGR